MLVEYNLQLQKLHVSPYKFPLRQEMLVQVPLSDSYEIPVHKTRVKQDLKLAQMLETGKTEVTKDGLKH